jgi:phosphoheptose isomerase
MAGWRAIGTAVVDTAQTIADVYRRDGCLFSMGNGGSSCELAARGRDEKIAAR